MAEPKTDENRVDELAEEFACRWRAGDRPSVEEYAARYPRWAEEIRTVLPAVVMMEQLKPHPSKTVEVGLPLACSEVTPRQVGEYRIVREIGRGGMGVVYEAEQEALGRRVAIKVLPASILANPSARERFRREAQAAARLHHTNIVPVFGVGECDGQCFYVMQLITGRGLDQVIREMGGDARSRPLPPSPPPRSGEGGARQPLPPAPSPKRRGGSKATPPPSPPPRIGEGGASRERSGISGSLLPRSPSPLRGGGRGEGWFRLPPFPEAEREEQGSGAARWPSSAPVWPTPSHVRMRKVSSTETSSRRTCFSTSAAPCG